MPECVIIASAKTLAEKKMQFHLVVNKTFCPTQPLLTYQQSNTKEQKLTKCFLPPTVFHTKFTISELKRK